MSESHFGWNKFNVGPGPQVTVRIGLSVPQLLSLDDAVNLAVWLIVQSGRRAEALEQLGAVAIEKSGA